LLPMTIATSGFDSGISEFGRSLRCRNFFPHLPSH
jgi:hypothetical protein